MKKLFTIFSIALIVFSCKRENMDFEGPNLQDLNGTFGFLKPFTADKNLVDFSKNETVNFTAEFTKICEWEIIIRGKTSGASKILSGKSRNLSVPSTVWNGTTTLFPTFKAEGCLATLKIAGVLDTFNLNIGVTGVRKPTGFVVANFEMGMNSKWTTLIQSGASMDFKIKSDKFSVEGNNYMNMSGIVNWDWLIGLVDFPGTAYSASTNYNLTSVSDDLYFNCLIYGAGNNVNTSRVLFQFKEDDNGNGAFDRSSDDQYDKEIIVDWAGWKLVSFKYTSLQHLVNGVPATNNGNSKHNSNKINTISMLHLANPANGLASTKVDCIMFTEKSPLEL